MHSPTPPLIVLDTNAVLDWLVFHDGGMAHIAQAIESRRVQWIATQAMWDELARVLVYPALVSRNPQVNELQAIWQRFARVLQAAPAAPLIQCSDADDQKFLDLALSCKAAWLISKDKALLALRKKAMAQGLSIVRPEQFAEHQAPHLLPLK